MSQTSEMVKTMFAQGDDLRDAGLVEPQDVETYRDICYGSDPVWQILDVYRPKNEEGQLLPVIVSVHGGGWVYGDKERYRFYTMSLAQRGFAVVNFTYRLAPEHKFPAPLEDTNLVFSWVLSHAAQYGFDTRNIFAVGDSAGAHCLCMYAAICTNPAYAAGFPFEVPKGFVPKAVALNCGVASIKLTSERTDLTSALMADYLPGAGTTEEIDAVSPAGHITEGFPPAFVMTAHGDFLRDETTELVSALIQKDIPTVCRFYKGKGKPLGHVFHLNMRSEMAQRCSDEECDFFREWMS